MIVAIGVALEGVEIVHDGIAWAKRRKCGKRHHAVLRELADIFPGEEARNETKPHSDHPKWVKRLLRIGLIAVVVGVVGEWRYGARLEGAHNKVHRYDLSKLLAADEKAGDAATSAKTAREVADAVQKKADALNVQLSATESRLKVVSGRADETDERLKVAFSMLSVRSIRNMKGVTDGFVDFARSAQLQKWPHKVVLRSYSGDPEAFNACILIALAMASPEAKLDLKVECGKEPLNFPFEVTGIAVTGADVFAVYKLRKPLLEDGGLGTVAEITGCGSCRTNGPNDPTEMEVFVGLNPGFSLTRLEDAEKRLKKQRTEPRKPKNP